MQIKTDDRLFKIVININEYSFGYCNVYDCFKYTEMCCFYLYCIRGITVKESFPVSIEVFIKKI